MIRISLMVFLVLLGTAAFAHSPVCVCKRQATQVVCVGGFADDSTAVGTRIDVIDYDETVLLSGELNKQSRFVFTVPKKPFYVLMDAAPGEMFEVDWTDIEGLNGFE